MPDPGTDASGIPERKRDARRDDVYEIPVTTIDGEQQTLGHYRGQALLVVNVASQCGYTPQYAGLESMYRRYRDRGFAVLGFPCDQFGHQEPGTEAEIRQFCSLAYDVTFPMFAKIDVNGPNEHPLYALLKSRARGILGTEAVKWNFTKFLVSRDGAVLARYSPRDTPEDIESDPAFVAAVGA
jgi:glutathione peroxidase